MVFLSLKKKLHQKKSSRSYHGVADCKKYSPKPSADDSLRTVSSDSQRSHRTVPDNRVDTVQASMYGYEDAAPDTAVKNSSKSTLNQSNMDHYGYELHNPSTPESRPRRSSMKGSNPGRRLPRRRHSISFEKKSARIYNDVADCKKYSPKPSADDSQLAIQTVSSDSQRSHRTVPDNGVDTVQASMYGYEDAAPDTAVKNSSKSTLNQSNMDPYGYELHNPSTPQTRPRRSSMKGSNPGRRLPRRRHSISFEEEVKVNKVVPIAELVKDKGDMWLQGEDYYNIINKVNTIVKRTASGKGPNFCTRGLESMIQRSAGMEDESRQEAWDTVLDEQEIQVTTGHYDEEMLSRKYRRCSNQSRMEAFQRGMQDENNVFRYLEDTRNYCRRMSM